MEFGMNGFPIKEKEGRTFL